MTSSRLRATAARAISTVIARACLAALGLASIAGGIVLVTVITVTWWPCADEMPLGWEFSPECHELASDAAPLPWVADVWPIAAVLAVAAGLAVWLRGVTERSRRALIALSAVTLCAFPLVEYATFAPVLGAWDALPWMGTGTAITGIFAGVLMLAASRPPVRVRSGERLAP